MRVLVLGSASPRRRELLERIGYDVEVAPAAIDEMARPGEDPEAYVRRLAAAKADAVAAVRRDACVLAADTTVALGGTLFGKPEDEREAVSMLSTLAGTTHRVTTAFAIRGPGAIDEAVTTHVTMRALSAEEIADYVAAGEWRGKAGGYAVQGIAAAFVSAVEGSITNVVGLPLAEVALALSSLGMPPRYRLGKPS